MQNAYEFTITLRDQVSNTLKNVGAGLNGMHNKIMQSKASWSDLGQSMIAFNQASQAIQQANQALESITRPGVEFQSSMADLKAITGLAQEQVEALGKSARDLGKEFGTDAARGVESYKLLLSQLGPDLAQTPEVLNEMARNANLLSKTMGGDTTAATQVLTTAMNQFQVDLQNPIAAAAEMTRQMNTMSAAAKEGSAELPSIKAALEQSGMAANTANVSFEETNAAIQILDKAGRRGSEGGIALRNVLATLSQGRFLPKDVQEQMLAAGVNINALGDETLTLAERLNALTPVMNDAALMGKLFGRENKDSAMALISQTQALTELTEKITGTNTTLDQANEIMGTHQERMNRMQAKFKDIGVTVFNATKSFLPYTAALGQTVMLGSQLLPVYTLARTGFIKAYQGVVRLTMGIKAMTMAKLAANAAWLVSPMGLVVMGITAAAGAYLLLRKRIDETTAAQRALNDVKQTAEESIVRERVEVQRLVGVMHDENATREQKNSAYKRLIEISPEYFGNLTFEEALTNKLSIAAEEYTKRLLLNASVKAAEDTIVENLKQQMLDEAKGASSQYNANSFLRQMFGINSANSEGITQAQRAGNEWKAIGNFLIGRGYNLDELHEASRQANLQTAGKSTELVNKTLSDQIQAWNNELQGLGGAVNENNPSPPANSSTAPAGAAGEDQESEEALRSGISSITSGGARATNININMGSLIESFTVQTQHLQQSVEEIHDKVVEALMMSLNSANAMASN